jgi:hypothetical protein
MPAAKPPRRGKRPQTKRRRAAPSVRTLERRLTRLAAERAAEAGRHLRRVAALRRAFDRRLATLVQEIARLRHHEARTEALERLLAEREAALAAQSVRIASLGSLLPKRTEIG